MSDGVVEEVLKLDIGSAISDLNRYRQSVADASKEMGHAQQAAAGLSGGTKEFAQRADDAGDTASRLAGSIGLISPAASQVISVFADLSDGARAAAEVSEALGVSLGTVLAGGGLLAAGLGLLTVAFIASNREIESAKKLTEAYHGANQALLPTIRSIRDAQIDLEEVTGTINKAQADALRAQYAAGDAVKSLAESQRQQRQELEASTRSAETWLDAVYSAESLVDPLGLGRAVRDAVGFGDVFVGLVDVVGGFSASVEDNAQQMDILNSTVEKEAENQKKLRDTVVETTTALEGQATAATKTGDALQAWAYNFNPGSALPTQDEASAQNRSFETPAPTPYPFTTAGELAALDEASAQNRTFSWKETGGDKPLEEIQKQWSQTQQALSSIGSGSVSGLLSMAGPAGAAAGAAFDLVGGFADRKSSPLDQMGDQLKNFAKGLPNIGKEFGEFIKDAAKNIIPAIIEGVPKMAIELAKTLGNPVFWVKIIAGLIQALADSIGDAIRSVMKLGKDKDGDGRGALGEVGQAVGGLFRGKRASGGFIGRTGLYLMHEGEEVVNPTGAGSGTAHMKRVHGAAPNVTLNITGGIIGPETAQSIVRELNRYMGSGNLNFAFRS